MLATDLERANHRVITAERQLENYKKLIERNQEKSIDSKVSGIPQLIVLAYK